MGISYNTKINKAFLLLLLIISQVSTNQDYFLNGKTLSFNYHTTEIEAIENVTLKVSETEKEQYVVSSSRTAGQIVAKKIFDFQEREIKFNLTNHSSLSIKEIIQIPKSNFIVLMSTEKCVFVNFQKILKNYYDQPTNNIEFTVNDNFEAITGLNIAKLPSAIHVQGDDYLFSFQINGGYKVYEFKIIDSVNFRIISNLQEKNLNLAASVINPECGTMFKYFNNQFIAFGMGDGKVKLFSLTLNQVILTDQVFATPAPAGQETVRSIKHIENTSTIAVQNSLGILKLFLLPDSSLPLINYNAEGLTEIDSNDKGIPGGFQKITQILNSNFILLTGNAPNLTIYDIKEKQPLVVLDNTSSISPGVFIGGAATYIKGSGYLVIKEFDTNVSNFQNRYALFPICPPNHILSQDFEGCQLQTDEDDGDINSELLITTNCGSLGYFNNFTLQCELCPNSCDSCVQQTYYDYGKNQEVKCRTCDNQGECICRHDKLCSSTFFDTNICDCSQQQCQIDQSDCPSLKIFDAVDCSCKDISYELQCTNNQLCKTCSSFDTTECLECKDSSKTLPDCLCPEKKYWNYKNQECTGCKQQNCLACTGDNGDICIQLETYTRDSNSVSYPVAIILGILITYVVSFIGMFSLKLAKKKLHELKIQQKQSLKPKNLQKIQPQNIIEKSEKNYGVGTDYSKDILLKEDTKFQFKTLETNGQNQQNLNNFKLTPR